MNIFAKGLFDGAVVVITGGGTGIGKQVAREIGSLGAKCIAICGRRIEPLKETASELEKEGINVFYGSCDIRNNDETTNFIKNVLQRNSRIDVLINNAGGQFPSPAEAISPKGFEAVIRNNLLGTWNMIHSCATLAFIPQQSGRIVNVIAGISRGFPGMVHTGSARAGVDNLTKTLSVEWAHYNIKVNAVAPGYIQSSGMKNYSEELVQRLGIATPLQRQGTEEEVSHLITFLSSEKASSYITGQTYYIDGGSSLWGDLFDVTSAKL